MGCAFECCRDIDANNGEGLTICEFVLGEFYSDQDTLDHESCYVDLFDTADGGDGSGQLNCFGCDLGCKPGVDSPERMKGGMIDHDGHGYMRPNPTRLRNRNAENALADFPVKRPDTMTELFTRKIHLQRPRCKSNGETHACWGDTLGHPCQCYREPHLDCDDHAIDGLPMPDNFPLPGMMRDRYFYHFEGWPMREPNITCSKWDHRTPLTGAWLPEYDVELNDHNEGQAQLAWFHTYNDQHDPSVNIDAITGCTAQAPQGSDCSTTEGDCGTGLRDGFGSIMYCGHGDSDCNQFEYMNITGWSPRFRGSSADVEFKNSVLAAVVNIEDTHGPFDAIQHQFGALGNAGVGWYKRTYERSLDEAHVVGPIEGVTRWGGFPVSGDVVITKVDFRSHVIVPRTQQWTHGQNPTRFEYLTPFAVVHIDITLGVRATLDATGPIEGADVVLSYPDGADFPTVTPEGNDIDYGSRVPAQIDWHGRLGYHSSPATGPKTMQVAPEVPQGTASQTNCKSQRYSVGTLEVPGYPADIDAADPNTHYDGSVSFRFSHES